MKVRDETAKTPSEVHGAKNNEVRDATVKERHVCARARDGERPVSCTSVDAVESVRRRCLARGAQEAETYLKQYVETARGEPAHLAV